jgi:hypothetical protein
MSVRGSSWDPKSGDLAETEEPLITSLRAIRLHGMASNPKFPRGEREGKWVLINEKDLAPSYRRRIHAAEVVHNAGSGAKPAPKRHLQHVCIYSAVTAGTKVFVGRSAISGNEFLSASKSAVPVDEKVLETAAKNTGIEDREELVNYALTLLADADPSAEFARQNRGALRGLRLDI